MKYAKNIIEAIGGTPLVKLNKVTKGVKATVLAKLEFMNPGGSTKDRIGFEMIKDAEEKGLINKGGTIIEPTSGNTGVGLAIAAAVYGYKVIFTMADKQSKEKEEVLNAYGAKVVRCPTNVAADDPRSYYQVALDLAKEIPNAYCPMQYNNPANTLAHYKTTGPEIWEATNGKITHFVAGMGTGGTITGVAKYLKKKNPKIKIIGVDPEGSVYHHLVKEGKTLKESEKEIHSYKVEGIGEDFIPQAIDLSLIDDVVLTEDKEIFLMAREIVKHEGILVGGSGAATVVAILKIAKTLPKNAVVVAIFPDSGRNYISKMYNDEWMRENKFL